MAALSAGLDNAEKNAVRNDDAYTFSKKIVQLGCGATCLKWMLVVMNAIFMIIGIVAAIAVAYANAAKISDLLDAWLTPAIILTAFLFLMALFGLYGAHKLNRAILWAYLILEGLLFVVVFIISIYALTQKSNSKNIITPAWKAANDDLRLSLQGTFECCGLWNVTDLVALPCVTNTTGLPCGPILDEAFVQVFDPVTYTGLSCSLLLLIGTVGASFLICAITDSGKRQAQL